MAFSRVFITVHNISRGSITVQKISKRLTNGYGFIDGFYKMRTKLISVTVNISGATPGISTETTLANSRIIPTPVTLATAKTRRKHQRLKVTTVTRMAALRRQKRRHLQG